MIIIPGSLLRERSRLPRVLMVINEWRLDLNSRLPHGPQAHASFHCPEHQMVQTLAVS